MKLLTSPIYFIPLCFCLAVVITNINAATKEDKYARNVCCLLMLIPLVNILLAIRLFLIITDDYFAEREKRKFETFRIKKILNEILPGHKDRTIGEQLFINHSHEESPLHNPEKDILKYTCLTCHKRHDCGYSWDIYNTDGDCLAEK